MKKWITAVALALSLVVGPAYAGSFVPDATIMPTVPPAPLTTEEAAELLSASIGQLKSNNRFACTAWKLFDDTWATARHCMRIGPKFKIEANTLPYSYTLYVRSFTIPAETATGFAHVEDWATLRVNESKPDIPNLTIDCKYELKIGEKVAYMGYPAAGRKPIPLFSTGVVSGINSLRYMPWHFTANLEGGGGASGSPVIALKTGAVIGFLTRGIAGSHGIMSVGVESVAGMDFCEIKEALEKIAAERGDPVNEAYGSN